MNAVEWNIYADCQRLAYLAFGKNSCLTAIKNPGSAGVQVIRVNAG
jgi:hypothetical protein